MLLPVLNAVALAPPCLNAEIPQPGQPSDLASLYSVGAVLIDSLPLPKAS